MRNEVFSKSSPWVKCGYEIQLQEGVQVIRPIKSSEIETYFPLHLYPEQTKNLNEQMPHTHLFNLDLSNNNEILRFVNKWGLLGLRDNHDYAKISESDLPYKQTPENLNKNQSSEWYKNPNGGGVYSRQEPLKIFIKAASQYQEIKQRISRNSVERVDIVDQLLFNQKLNRVSPSIWLNEKKNEFGKLEFTWESGWNFTSLLDVCYFLSFYYMNGGHEKNCIVRNCNKLFVNLSHNPDCCSDKCRSNRSSENLRHRKRVKELQVEFPDVGWLEDFILGVLAEGGRNDIRVLRKKIDEEIKRKSSEN